MLQRRIVAILMGMLSSIGFAGMATSDETPPPQLIVAGRTELPVPPVIRIQYVAESPDFACTVFVPGAGIRDPRTRDFDYKPEVSGAEFSVVAPLAALKPGSRCQWRPRLVHVCVETSCTNVAAIDPAHLQASPPEANLRCRLESASGRWTCKDPNPSRPERKTETSTLRVNLLRE
jgi:hypothetical protein